MPTESAGENMTNGAIKALKDKQNKEEVKETSAAITEGAIKGVTNSRAFESTFGYPGTNTFMLSSLSATMVAASKGAKAFVEGGKSGGPIAKRAAVATAAGLLGVAAGGAYKEYDMNNKALEAAERQRAEEARKAQEEQARIQEQARQQMETSFTRRWTSAVGLSSQKSSSEKDDQSVTSDTESISKSKVIQDILDRKSKENQTEQQAGFGRR